MNVVPVSHKPVQALLEPPIIVLGLRGAAKNTNGDTSGGGTQKFTAAHHAHLATGHHEHAMHHAAEAAKAHIEDHGKAIPATA